MKDLHLHLHPRIALAAAEALARSLGRDIRVEDGRARLLAPPPETYLVEVERAGVDPVYRAWRLGGIRPRPLADSDRLDQVLAALRADIEETAGAVRPNTGGTHP